eukprot:ANDGO_01560.mRNA.1 hypothetical protein
MQQQQQQPQHSSAVYFTPQQLVMPHNRQALQSHGLSPSLQQHTIPQQQQPQQYVQYSTLPTLSNAASRLLVSRSDPSIAASVENAYDRRVAEARIALDNLRHTRERHLTARGHVAELETSVLSRKQAHLVALQKKLDEILRTIDDAFHAAVRAAEQVEDVLLMPLRKTAAAIERNVAELDRVAEMVHLKFQVESKAEFVATFPLVIPAVREALAVECPVVRPVDFNACDFSPEFLKIRVLLGNGSTSIQPSPRSTSALDQQPQSQPQLQPHHQSGNLNGPSQSHASGQGLASSRGSGSNSGAGGVGTAARRDGSVESRAKRYAAAYQKEKTKIFQDPEASFHSASTRTTMEKEKDELIAELTQSYKELERMHQVAKIKQHHSPHQQQQVLHSSSDVLHGVAKQAGQKGSLMDEYLGTQIERLNDLLSDKLTRLETIIEEQRVAKMERKIAREEASTNRAAIDRVRHAQQQQQPSQSQTQTQPQATVRYAEDTQGTSRPPMPAGLSRASSVKSIPNPANQTDRAATTSNMLAEAARRNSQVSASVAVPQQQPQQQQQQQHLAAPTVQERKGNSSATSSSYEYVYEVVEGSQASLGLQEGEEVVAEQYVEEEDLARLPVLESYNHH